MSRFVQYFFCIWFLSLSPNHLNYTALLVGLVVAKCNMIGASRRKRIQKKNQLNGQSTFVILPGLWPSINQNCNPVALMFPL